LVRWTGDNADEVTAALGTEDWRYTTVAGTRVEVGWYLYRDDVGVNAMSPDVVERYYERVD
jgi:hypothetical protein